MSQFVTGNQVTLLSNGAEYFPALMAAINAAQKEIYLQTYIFELDQTGLAIGDALMKAATRGASVYLLLDGFGCKNLPREYAKTLSACGVEVLFFRPKISPWTFNRSRLRRLHSKVAVIDGSVGFVGGINIIDDFNTPFHTAPRIDYAVRVEGLLLKNMQTSVALQWKKVCQSQFKKVKNNMVLNQFKQPFAGDMWAAFLVRDNFKHRRDIEDAYLSAIVSAKSDILIANAYFLPGLRFRHALRDAAAKGVRVTLLLQGRTEYWLLDFATHALYSMFLSQGIKIYEYHKSFMHSKVAVVDGRVATVGSSNIDPFSLFLSQEANIVVDNQPFAEQLRDSIQKSINFGATLVTEGEWQQHYRLKRFISWIIYGFVRLLIGVVGTPEGN